MSRSTALFGVWVEVRAKLLAAAAELLAAEGRRALSTRRLAAAVGTSTMAVYTYFGSMARLQHEVRRNGFERLCAALDAVPHTADPVAGLAALVRGYVDVGSAEPLLYRAIFTDREPTEEQDEGSGVFDRFLAGLGRCIDAGRFHAAEPTLTKVWAAQLWLAAHGPHRRTHRPAIRRRASISRQRHSLPLGRRIRR